MATGWIMTTSDTSPTSSGPLRLAADVTLTRLPFGGAVLVHGVTLALAEFAEGDTEVVMLLLAGGNPAPAGNAGSRRIAKDLAAAGWLMRDGDPASRPA